MVAKLHFGANIWPDPSVGIPCHGPMAVSYYGKCVLLRGGRWRKWSLRFASLRGGLLAPPELRLFIFKTMVLKNIALNFSPVQIFYASVTENSEVTWPESGQLLQTQILQILGSLVYIPGHWPLLTHCSLLIDSVLTQHSDFNCVPEHFLCLALSFLNSQLWSVSCLCSRQFSMSHWVNPTIWGSRNP